LATVSTGDEEATVVTMETANKPSPKNVQLKTKAKRMAVIYFEMKGTDCPQRLAPADRTVSSAFY
jgi:hypothetical protein